MPHIDPELPWGCWLRIERRAAKDVHVDDETGLAFPMASEYDSEKLTHHLLAVMASSLDDGPPALSAPG